MRKLQLCFAWQLRIAGPYFQKNKSFFRWTHVIARKTGKSLGVLCGSLRSRRSCQMTLWMPLPGFSMHGKPADSTSGLLFRRQNSTFFLRNPLFAHRKTPPIRQIRGTTTPERTSVEYLAETSPLGRQTPNREEGGGEAGNPPTQP